MIRSTDWVVIERFCRQDDWPPAGSRGAHLCRSELCLRPQRGDGVGAGGVMASGTGCGEGARGRGGLCLRLQRGAACGAGGVTAWARGRGEGARGRGGRSCCLRSRIGRDRSADRLCQCRESVHGARRGASTRSRCAPCNRRGTWTTRAPAAGRSGGRRRPRQRAGDRARVSDLSGLRPGGTGRHSSPRERRAEPRDGLVHARRSDLRCARVRRGAGVGASAPDFTRLREGGRGSTRRRHWGRDALVVGQTALALVLLIGSGLLLRSFWALRDVDPGYDTRDVFTFQIAPEGKHLPDGPAYARLSLAFMDRLRALPGVESVGLVENVPLNEGTSSGRFRAEGASSETDAGTLLRLTFTAGDYFKAMGIRSQVSPPTRWCSCRSRC